MKNIIIGIILGLITTATASYFSFQSQKTTVSGKTCIVVKAGSGVGVSCDWSR